MGDAAAMPDAPSPGSSVERRRVSPVHDFVRFEKKDVEQSIAARFEQQVRRYPERLAVKTGQHELSYEALNRLANRIARAILELGTRHEEPIALLLAHDAPFIAALLAVLKTGNIYVPLDGATPRPRLAYILDDSQAGLILTDNANADLVAPLAGDRRRVLNVDSIGEGLAEDDLALPVSPDTVANITYTSGSTGEPKGVIQTHRGALHAALRRINNLHISSDDRSVLLYPFSFSAARQVTFAALLNGAALLPFHVKTEGLVGLADWLIREEVTVLDWLPTGFRHFVASLTGHEEFPRLRLIAMSSEPVSAGDVELYKKHFSRHCIFANMLASTEAGPIRMYFLDRETRLTTTNVPAGYPVEHMEILLLDVAGSPVGPERAGEIVIKSRYFAAGYWRKPELTAATFLPAPDGGDERIFRTGDLGRMRPDGCLEVVGRRDSMVKIRGYRVEPTEVELALLELPAVREAAVVAREDAAGEQQLAAYVVPAESPGPASGTLRSLLQTKLPDYMLPAAFVSLEALPLTPNGKLDRRSLPVPDLSRLEAGSTLVGPRNEIEAQLVQIWQDLLGARPIGIRDDFFELGGHSLLAARLFARIEQTFGQHIPMSVLIEGATIEHLANLVAGHGAAGLASLVAIQASGSRPPFFCVHPLWGDVLIYRPLARLLGPDQPFYGLRAVGSDGSEMRSAFDTIEEMAAHYIREIRTVQPHGPYLLGGFSLGGVVAFEMARQLRGAGHEVGLLVVIDSSLPAEHPTGREPASDQIPKLIRQLARLWNFPHRHSEFAETHHRMLKAYRPRPYPGRIIFFRAEEASPLSLLGPQEREVQEIWAPLAIGGIEIRNVPGSHISLLQEPYISDLAVELKRCLEQVACRDVRTETHALRPCGSGDERA